MKVVRHTRETMKILIVDAGNYCRSPAAECVLKAMIAASDRAMTLHVGSAGLKDKHAGDGADPRSIAACAARGYDLTAHRCREITTQDFHECALILAMDRDNLAQLQRRRPAESVARLELYLGDTEVPDPYDGGESAFVEMMEQIENGARGLIQDLRAAR